MTLALSTHPFTGTDKEAIGACPLFMVAILWTEIMNEQNIGGHREKFIVTRCIPKLPDRCRRWRARNPAVAVAEEGGTSSTGSSSGLKMIEEGTNA